jgi:hypothetical protein
MQISEPTVLTIKYIAYTPSGLVKEDVLDKI